MREMQVHSLGRGGPLEKEMGPHSSILAWRIPWTEEPEAATVHGVAELDTTSAKQQPHCMEDDFPETSGFEFQKFELKLTVVGRG